MPDPTNSRSETIGEPNMRSIETDGQLFVGKVENPRDVARAVSAVMQGDLAVVNFGPTYGIVGIAQHEMTWGKIAWAKGISLDKFTDRPLSAFVQPGFLRHVADPEVIHPEVYDLIMHPELLKHVFLNISFLKFGIKPDALTRELVAACYRKKMGQPQKQYDTLNALLMPEDDSGHPFYTALLHSVSNVYGIEPEKVLIPVSSCNLSGRGSNLSDPLHIEIIDPVTAELFAQNAYAAGVRAVLHSDTLNVKGPGSYWITTATPFGVYQERQGNIADHHYEAVMGFLPKDLVTQAKTIARNHTMFVEAGNELDQGLSEDSIIDSTLPESDKLRILSMRAAARVRSFYLGENHNLAPIQDKVVQRPAAVSQRKLS